MLTLAQASAIVDHALSYARAHNLAPMTIAALDARGCIVALKMEDGSGLMRPDIAAGKAWGALGLGFGTRNLAGRASSLPQFFGALADLADGRVLPVPGGVLVRDQERRVIGAVGASGDVADNDEATVLAGIAAVSGLLADPGQAPADPLVAAKATASTAAAKPEVVSALTLPRPAHDITVSKDGRIFMMMVDAPALVEWMNGELHAYPDAGWNDTKAPDHSHALVRPCSLRIGPDGLLWVLDTGQPGVDHGGPKFVAFDLETNALVRSYPLDAGALTGSFYDDFRFNGRNVYLTDIAHGAIVVLNLDTGALRRTLDGDPSTKGSRPMIVEGKELPPVFGLGRTVDVDMLEVSADGRWLYYQPGAGPMSRIETRWIDDPQISDAERGKQVQFWADTQTTGGTAIDAEGNIYASDPDKLQLLKIDPTGQISTFVADPRMLFVDEMWIDEKGFLWMPAVQLNRLLIKGGPPPQLPFQVLKVQTRQKPVHR